jgi:CheY-like chemotaxis protein
VRLPLLSPAAAPGRGASERAGVIPRRVLIVEDSEDVRESLRILLELDGHEVVVAPDGSAGLERLQALRPDVALIDFGLPRLDGLTLAARIRATPGGERFCLIALTGYGRPEDRERAVAAGFDAFLVKPVDYGELTGVLARLPTGRSLER